MMHELAPMDIHHALDFPALVEEVRTTRTPRRIVRDDDDLAVLMPAPANRRRHKARPAADIEAAIALAGAWRDQIDPAAFKRERRALQADDKPQRTA